MNGTVYTTYTLCIMYSSQGSPTPYCCVTNSETRENEYQLLLHIVAYFEVHTWRYPDMTPSWREHYEIFRLFHLGLFETKSQVVMLSPQQVAAYKRCTSRHTEEINHSDVFSNERAYVHFDINLICEASQDVNSLLCRRRSRKVCLDRCCLVAMFASIFLAGVL